MRVVSSRPSPGRLVLSVLLPTVRGMDEEASASADSQRTAGREPTVGQCGEQELLDSFLPLLRAPAGSQDPHGGYTLLGPGDDCAVIAAPDSRFVISTDTQVQGQDFLLRWPSGAVTTGADTGAKAAAQNLADAAAMGAVPSALTVSLSLPRQTPVRWVQDFARGLVRGIADCGADQASVVGGDLGAGTELSVTVTVTGDLQGREPVRRSGARAGQDVVLAGTVGRAAAGLALLQSQRYRPGEDPALDELAAAQLRPVAPVRSGAALAQCGASAMIDVSDGLVRDAGRIAGASGVVVDLELEALRRLAEPLLPAARLLEADPLEWVLAGGEDHGLLACLPPGSQVPLGVVGIGSVRPSEPPAAASSDAEQEPAGRRHAEVTVGGRAVEEILGADRGRGWDHFERAHRSEHGGRPAVAGPGSS